MRPRSDGGAAGAGFFATNLPKRPATLGRTSPLETRLAECGGCGFARLALGGVAMSGFDTRGAGGFARRGGRGRPPTRAASECGGARCGLGAFDNGGRLVISLYEHTRLSRVSPDRSADLSTLHGAGYPPVVTTSSSVALAPSSIDVTLGAELSMLDDTHLLRRLRFVGQRAGARIVTERGEKIDFSSNDYLGLASDQRLVEAMAAGARHHGVGAAAARLISGHTPEHEALDRELAAWFGADRALSFSSGYAANVGIIPALVGRPDVIFADGLNHASVIDGCRLSRATVHVYPHADINALARLLEEHRATGRRAMIATDGLFSMDGDEAPLVEIVELARQFDAWTYVDDAHAVGIGGPGGRGTASGLGIAHEVDVNVGTLGKAFGVAGAFVYGSSTLCDFLLNKARSFVFSTGMSPGQCAAVREALRIADAEPWRRERLRANARAMRRALAASGVSALGDPDSYIVPVVIGDPERTMRVAAAVADRGYLVGAVRPPTVPAGTSRLRIAVSAAHAQSDIEGLGLALAQALGGEAE